MIKSTVNMPLLCWKCLSKDVRVDKNDRVYCFAPHPVNKRKICGFKVSRREWFKLAQGSLPSAGRNQEWLINVVIPPGARIR